jgi:N12 class adenine-specific DNA methylase
VFEVELAEKPLRDFRITTAHRIGDGGLHEKARDNLAAIRLAKSSKARTATQREKNRPCYRMHTRFAKFVNLPELLSIFRSFADVQTTDMLPLPRPTMEGGKPQITAAPSSPELKAYVETLVDRAQKLRSMKIDPSVDNMLKITGDGRKAVLDMRLVDPSAKPGETKVTRAIEKIRATWAVGKEQR